MRRMPRTCEAGVGLLVIVTCWCSDFGLIWLSLTLMGNCLELPAFVKTERESVALINGFNVGIGIMAAMLSDVIMNDETSDKRCRPRNGRDATTTVRPTSTKRQRRRE